MSPLHIPLTGPNAHRLALAAFASINHPGAPIHPDDLAGLLRFGEGWVPSTNTEIPPCAS